MIKVFIALLTIIVAIYYSIRGLIDDSLSLSEAIAILLLFIYAIHHVIAYLWDYEMYAGVVPISNNIDNKIYRIIVLIIAMSAYLGVILWIENL